MNENLLSVSMVRNIQKNIAMAKIGLGLLFLYGLVTYVNLSSLENGDVVNVWAPIKYAYENYGVYGVFLPFLVISFFLIIKLGKAYSSQKKMIAKFGQEVFDNRVNEFSIKVPRILQNTDKNGKYPKRTKILGILMAIIFGLIFLGAKFGYIH